MSVLYTLCLTRLQCWKVGIIIPILQIEETEAQQSVVM